MPGIPRYAVTDIETTGGAPGKGRITEIAVFIVEDNEIVDEFVSLINPEQNIPPYISRLTGITNEMVARAPKFYDVARRIVEITSDTIFVAHNASFDYNFLRREFESLGYTYTREVLCTVRWSRKIIPGYASYSLGVLCAQLGISLQDRHRAGGDAKATALLLIHLIKIQVSAITSYDEVDLKGLHPDLKMETIKALPRQSGVYYFHNPKGEVIYVGKSKNIYNRVLSHLSARGKRAVNMKMQLADISYEETGSELLALLKEMEEIKQLKPLFNRAGRRTRFNWGLYNYRDRAGYERFFVQKITDSVLPLDAFSSREAATTNLYQLAEKFNLCHRLCGLGDKTGACFNHSVHQCNGACLGKEPPHVYNLRTEKMISSLSYSSRCFVLIDEGRHSRESSFVWVENNVLKGYGWIDSEEEIRDPSQLTDFIAGGSDNRDTRQILRGWLKNKMTRRMKLVTYQ